MPLSFHLDDNFVNTYKDRKPSFGFNGLGEFVFYRTYSRDGEDWAQVCARVINGMYSFQKEHCASEGRHWNEDKGQASAREAFDLMFDMKWTPPGRGLWMMGTPFVHERGVPEALNNCAFISSKYIVSERGDFFRWMMEMSMLGVGVGFDTLGAGALTFGYPAGGVTRTYVVEDTRQSWAESVQALFDSYVSPGSTITFDYGSVRPAGTRIAGFGGVASGPAPLVHLHEAMRTLLEGRIGQGISSRDIVDIANLIGQCVVAGNVRRSAEIAIGSPQDNAFINLKNYDLNPDRAAYGWVSNNSVVVERGQDYLDLARRTYDNGEPGYIWLDNVRNYGRMNGRVDTRDADAMGFNPCAEQPLHHREMCTLAEIHLPRITTKAEFVRAIKAAFLYGQSVTLASTSISDSATRERMLANRRIGVSLTGQTQFVAARGMDTMKDWMTYGYELTGYWNSLYASWLGVPESIRRTSVKPSGTVSLLTGSTPGVHFPISRFHIRRVSVAANSPLVERMFAAGYRVEPSVVDPTGTMIVEFPVDAGKGVRTEGDVSVEDQFEMAATAQELWADNGVSVTIKFNKKVDSPESIAKLLTRYESRLKAVSLLPYEDNGYEQAPYEAISEGDYLRKASLLKGTGITYVEDGDRVADMFCDTEACTI